MKRFLLLFLLLLSPNLCANDRPGNTATIGLPAFWDKERTRKQWEPLVQYLTKATGTAFELKVGGLDELEQAVAQKQIDFIFINPSIYVLYTYRYGLSSPLATVINRIGDQRVRQFAGVVFTSADNSAIDSLRDLKGKKIAAVSPQSLAAYQMQRYELLQLGIKLPEDAQMQFTGLPLPQVVKRVLSGGADAGFMRAGVLEKMQANGQLPQDRVKILGSLNSPNFPVEVSTRLYPEWPFAALQGVSDELTRKVSNALLSLPWDGEVAKNLQIVGFNVPGDYRVVDQLLQELRLPPFDKQSVTLEDFWQTWQYLIVAGLLLFSLFLLVLLLALKRNYKKLLLSQNRIHHLAYYDSLSGVQNRVSLLEDLARLKDSEADATVVLLNLDRFKSINSARGSRFCDHLLQLIAKHLISLFDSDATIYRVGADEFALIGQAADRRWCDKLATLTHLSLEHEGEMLHLSFSLGVSDFPLQKDDSAEAVLKRVTIALAEAKSKGGAQKINYLQTMGELVKHDFEIERELPEAIRNDELQLYLQPQFDKENILVSAEVLVRWQHPRKGVISPGAFIPVAERSNLIVDMGRWVLKRSFEMVAKSKEQGKEVALSINISAKHFRQIDFVSQVVSLLEKTGVQGDLITLEVTESLFIDDIEDIISKMQQLSLHGIKFSIDDFGTGYSSLSYLKKLPIHEIKIDKTFVQGATTNADDAALVEMIIAVAHKLQLQVVAEGVETQEQADFLNAKTQLLHQGFLFGRPKPAQEWLQKWGSR